MVRKVNNLNKTAHKTKPVSKRRLQYLLHKAEVLSNQYKAERDTLIDDIAVLKANISRLERENEKLRKVNSNGWKQKDKVINNLHYLYSTLTNYIRLKAENNPGVSRYIDLVNYIDRLERD